MVLDDLLNEVLGLSVGVGAAAGGMLLVDGEALRVAVHCRRAAEDQIVHPVSLHHLGRMQAATRTAHTSAVSRQRTMRSRSLSHKLGFTRVTCC